MRTHPRIPARTTAVGLLLTVLLGATSVARAEPDAPGPAPVRFTEHLVRGGYGYAYGLAATDLDGDGDLDLTSGDVVGKPSASSLLLFENDGQGAFQEHLIHQGEPGWFERHAHGDISGDGRPDVAIVNNKDGHLLWFANSEQPYSGPWQRYVITTNCPRVYDVVLADLDSDGDPDAAAAGYSYNTFTWYENPGSSGWDREWTGRQIDEKMSEARLIRAGDFNADGKLDLLGGAVGAENVPLEVTDPNNHGARLVWYENPGQPSDAPWARHVIDDRSRAPIHGHPTDLDGDGDLDVVVALGMRKALVPEELHEVAWYENVGQPGVGHQWRKHSIGGLPSAFEAYAADLDGDGDVDVAATAWAKGDRLVWFENQGDPQGAWTMHVLKENWYAANQVIVADLDGDGRPDIAATADDGSGRVLGALELRWWRNEGP